MSNTTTQSTGLSGKRVALLVTFCMVVVGATLGYTLWVYSQLDVARESTANAWRLLATQLDSRYRALELQIVAEEATDGTVNATQSGDVAADLNVDAEATGTFEAKFRMALDGFRTTAQISSQRPAADRVEAILASNESSLSSPGDSTPELDSAVDSFNEKMQVERELLNTPGGKLLDVFMGFPQHAAFQLAR